jgi:hypothetical protein
LDVVVESELIGEGERSALAIRVLDARSGAPLARVQRILGERADVEVARELLAEVESELPGRLPTREAGIPRREAGERDSTAVTQKEARR